MTLQQGPKGPDLPTLMTARTREVDKFSNPGLWKVIDCLFQLFLLEKSPFLT